MPQDILVVEYEPRYTERVKNALNGRVFVPRFAKDGEEALSALESRTPELIVLSSIIPKVTTAELIRVIRGRSEFKRTPILLTVSGYAGKSPSTDAQRLGASDILPKPYNEAEFLQKVQQILGDTPQPEVQATSAGPAPAVSPGAPPPAPEATVQLNTKDLMAEMKEKDKPAEPARTVRIGADELDKILADTLAGVKASARKKPEPTAETPIPPSASPSRSKNASAEFDKLLESTLSGLERSGRPRPHGEAGPVDSPAASLPEPEPLPAEHAAPVATAPPAPVAEEPEPEPFPSEADVAPFPMADEPSPHAVAPPPAEAEAAPTVMVPLAEVKESAPAVEDGIQFGQYVLIEKIATGGMAEVWKARMRGVEGFEKIVAIKKILPHLSDNQEFVEMFIDEAKLAAQLNHNNIIHIYDLGKIASSYYIAMEYIEGCDLKTILRQGDERSHPIPLELSVFVASKVAAALDYAHRKRDMQDREMGLVHRDVSPQNVLISHEGDIKLCDFGIAKAASKASHTQAGALKGKLQYMSPEQAWGRPIDRRSDIFALATVLFEMLTGRKLFTGENEISILDQVREAKVVAPSTINDEVPPDVDAIVLKALQKEPEGRYQTAAEMARDLDAVLYGFRPTPTSADLAIYMHRLFSEQPPMAAPIIEEPAVPAAQTPTIEISTPQGIERIVAPKVESTPASAFEPVVVPETQPAGGRKSMMMPLIAGVVIVLGLAGGGFFYFRSRSTASQPTSAPAATTSATAVPAVQPSTQNAAPVPTET
ncbi:MAG: protein kinase, partial [Thermoanaerobaculia bacterium]